MNAHPHLVLQSSSAFVQGLLPSFRFSNIGSPSTQRPRAVPRDLQTTKKILPTPVFATGAADLHAADRFHAIDFHHVEFWCTDAASAAGRFSFALGVPPAAHSDLTTGNTKHASRLLRSRTGPLAFLFTAPYAPHYAANDSAAASSSMPVPVPSFSADAARRFAADYGLAVRAVAVRASDAAEAFRASVDAGASLAFAPAELGHGFVFAEVELYGDAVLRFVSYPDDTDISFLPGFESVPNSSECPDFGLNRFDHIVGGVPDLAPAAAYIAGFTGFHEFHRVNGDEVGTAESSLNGLVLANSSECVLLTLLEPVNGTNRRSSIQTFLDHHGGPGLQHLAMATDDLLGTLREIRARSAMGGFELLPPPPPSYYDGVRRLAGDVLSEVQIKECQELGVWVARGDNGGLVLQVMTKAAGDRPTWLLEFMQRIGCRGFGTGNVIDLFKSIEDYDKTLDAPACVSS